MDGDDGKVVQVSCVCLVGFVSELRWSYCCQWRGSCTGNDGEGGSNQDRAVRGWRSQCDNKDGCCSLNAYILAGTICGNLWIFLVRPVKKLGRCKCHERAVGRSENGQWRFRHRAPLGIGTHRPVVPRGLFIRAHAGALWGVGYPGRNRDVQHCSNYKVELEEIY